jgi:hypothetical protein
MITRQQEIELWKLLAQSLKLKYIGDGFYRGDCYLCKFPRLFSINVNKNYARCINCNGGGQSLPEVLQAVAIKSKTI